MAKSKAKFYVVWRGARPGIYSSWTETAEQVQGFPGAQFKGFATRAEAEAAYAGQYASYVGKSAPAATLVRSRADWERMGVDLDAVAVDAACAGVPGPLEYQGVEVRTGETLFHEGPFENGTNNIGEFLAIVDAVRLLAKQGRPRVTIYSDSRTALSWVRDKTARTNLERTAQNQVLFFLLAEAEQWLRSHPVTNPLVKWETEEWGEIPADFGRK